MSGAIFKGVVGNSQCSSKNVKRNKKKHSLAKTYGVLSSTENTLIAKITYQYLLIMNNCILSMHLFCPFRTCTFTLCHTMHYFKQYQSIK